MGRLRSDRDAQFLCDRAAEVTALFGTEDARLFRYIGKEQENLDNKDPLWDEPTTTVFYESYNVQLNWFDFNTTALSTEHGRDEETELTAYIPLGILVAAGVPVDPDDEYIAPGDVLEVHSKCGHQTLQYDIIQVNRSGWVNSSDKFTGYELTELKRRDKYLPERKTES